MDRPRDQIAEVLGTNRVRNNHGCEEGDAGCENEAVDKYDEARLFQVGQLGDARLPIDLRQRFSPLIARTECPRR